MALFHMATMLSAGGLKNFVLHPLNSLPSTSTRGLQGTNSIVFDRHGRRVSGKGPSQLQAGLKIKTQTFFLFPRCTTHDKNTFVFFVVVVFKIFFSFTRTLCQMQYAGHAISRQ